MKRFSRLTVTHPGLTVWRPLQVAVGCAVPPGVRFTAPLRVCLMSTHLMRDVSVLGCCPQTFITVDQLRPLTFSVKTIDRGLFFLSVCKYIWIYESGQFDQMLPQGWNGLYWTQLPCDQMWWIVSILGVQTQWKFNSAQHWPFVSFKWWGLININEFCVHFLFPYGEQYRHSGEHCL